MTTDDRYWKGIFFPKGCLASYCPAPVYVIQCDCDWFRVTLLLQFFPKLEQQWCVTFMPITDSKEAGLCRFISLVTVIWNVKLVSSAAVWPGCAQNWSLDKRSSHATAAQPVALQQLNLLDSSSSLAIRIRFEKSLLCPWWDGCDVCFYSHSWENSSTNLSEVESSLWLSLCNPAVCMKTLQILQALRYCLFWRHFVLLKTKQQTREIPGYISW